MAKTLITYDASGRQIEMKNELKRLGYMDSWQSDNRTYYLPGSVRKTVSKQLRYSDVEKDTGYEAKNGDYQDRGKNT